MTSQASYFLMEMCHLSGLLLDTEWQIRDGVLRPQRKEKYVEAIGSDPLPRLPQSVDWSRWSSQAKRVDNTTTGDWSVSLRLDRHSEVQIGFAEFSRPGAQLQFLAFCDPTFSPGGLVGTGILRFWR